MVAPSKQHCIFCKSTYHTWRACPMIGRMGQRRELNAMAKQEYVGEVPNIFVGQYGYPRVNVGLLNVEEYKDHDEPLKWSRENTQIPTIVDLRTRLINSTFQQHVKSFSDRLTSMAQEVSMAKRPAEVEVALSKRPRFTVTFNESTKPHGPNVRLTRANFTTNVATDPRIEKRVDDTDLKAAPALTGLYKKGVDEHRLTRLLSIGNLGVKAQRKLVPTQWSITAVDDTLGKRLIEEVKECPEGDCRVYTGGHLGNAYVILCFDDVWSYELFEGWLPRLKTHGDAAWETDYENYLGRKEYAQETAGGYYAARLAILEHLRQRQRQASILALRFVTEAYSVPLGVWVVREAVRKTMAAKPQCYPDRTAMQRAAVALCKERFGYDVAPLLAQRSRLLKNIKVQTRLRQWF